MLCFYEEIEAIYTQTHKPSNHRYKLFVSQVQALCIRGTNPLYQEYKPFVLLVRDYRNNRKESSEQPQGTILINVRSNVFFRAFACEHRKFFIPLSADWKRTSEDETLRGNQRQTAEAGLVAGLSYLATQTPRTGSAEGGTACVRLLWYQFRRQLLSAMRTVCQDRTLLVQEGPVALPRRVGTGQSWHVP